MIPRSFNFFGFVVAPSAILVRTFLVHYEITKVSVVEIDSNPRESFPSVKERFRWKDKNQIGETNF